MMNSINAMNTLNKSWRPVGLWLLSALSLLGCASQQPSAMPGGFAMPETVQPEPSRTMVDSAGGSIYQSNTSLTLFEDLVARRVGDILTINLVESTNATKSASTSTSKSNSATITNPTVLGYNVTRDGVPILSGNLGGDQEFTGEGDSTQSNRLEGSVTVTVMKRLPNGNLFVRGEKWLTLNQGKEYVRLSGIVRPVDILSDNTISSEKVANARIEYAGRGPLADANKMNWLARFFSSPLMPF